MSMTDSVSLPQLLDWLRAFNERVNENKAYLTELDSAIGDADHGANMARGMTAVVGQLEGAEATTVDALFKKVGMTLVSTVGGASGPLYGTFFMKFAGTAGAVSEVDATQLGAALRAGLSGVAARGKAEAGDKTMIDAMTPAVAAFEQHAAEGIAAAASAAATAAAEGRDAVTPLVARKGRASYLGERSAGHQDPGATSTTYLFEALAAAVS